VHDRLCRLAITYQDAAAERGIVTLRAPLPDLKPAVYERLVADAVAVTRATREHEDIRQGSSVRGAIDLTLVAGELFLLDSERGLGSAGWAHDTDGGEAGGSANDTGSTETGDRDEAQVPAEETEQRYRDTVYDGMIVALSGRIFLDETVEVTPEQVLRQIWEDHFILDPATAAPG
jgi:MoxR-like ATPase